MSSWLRSTCAYGVAVLSHSILNAHLLVTR